MVELKNSRFKLLKNKSFQILVTILLILILRPAPRYKGNRGDQESIRGVWMTNVGVSFLHHTLTLDNIFHHLAKSGYNQVYVSTYGLTGTIYPSARVKSHPLFLPPFTDVLKAIENETKRQNLQLYAWLEYGLMVHPTNHIAIEHPDWLLTTSTGETVVNDFVWLNPENLEVQKYILDIITEVAQYDLAGIQLDDHWAVPIQFGNKVQAMNQLTSKIRQRMKEINPELKLSISPNPYGFSLNKYNQDWLGWAKQGHVDELVIQIYRPDAQKFAASINSSQIDQLPAHIPSAIGIYTGNFQNILPPEEVQKQIDIAQQLGHGYSIFCWEYRIFSRLINK